MVGVYWGINRAQCQPNTTPQPITIILHANLYGVQSGQLTALAATFTHLAKPWLPSLVLMALHLNFYFHTIIS
jgi:hypothetical protein